nr:ROK family protein [Micromonospora sp. DSM 115978]
EQGVARPAGLGIGLPGPVNFHSGAPVAPPIMPGWDGYPVRDALSRELGCHVLVDNDVNAMALGELHAGVARSARDFLFVKIGTGIGCGIVVDGRLYRGVDGCAGDIGHMRVEEYGPTCACGNPGCLEAFFSGAALMRDATAAARSGRSPERAALLAAKGALTATDVGTAAQQGD